MEQYIQMVTDRIRQAGWIVQFVGGSETEPAFAYTVGLTALQRSEIIIMGGFPPEIAKNVVNRAAESDELQTDWAIGQKVLKNHSVIFREVTDLSARQQARVAFRIYGSKVKLVQMFLPDKDGHFPWEADCNAQFRGQAVLSYVSDSRA